MARRPAWTPAAPHGMLRRVGLRTWLGQRRPSKTEPLVRLRPAAEAIERYRGQGADGAAAIEGARQQLEGLRRELDDDARWDRLVLMARRIGDPWNADDWPLGFDGLLCATSLCTHVSFECARCPVGRRQDGRSCAHPSSAFGRISELLRRGDREGLREHVASVQRLLDELSRER